jgi:hypothetical protein
VQGVYSGCIRGRQREWSSRQADYDALGIFEATMSKSVETHVSVPLYRRRSEKVEQCVGPALRTKMHGRPVGKSRI